MGGGSTLNLLPSPTAPMHANATLTPLRRAQMIAQTCLRRRTVFSHTPKRLAMARSEAPPEASWAIIWARLSGVKVALACMGAVGEGRRLSVLPPPSWQTSSVRDNLL